MLVMCVTFVDIFVRCPKCLKYYLMIFGTVQNSYVSIPYGLKCCLLFRLLNMRFDYDI
jgi:hypothetical protein